MSDAPAAPVNKWAVAVAVAIGALLEIIDTSIVNVALADMQASLGATLTQVSWVVSSYAVANVIVLPLTAWLGQRFGKKRYFVFSLAGFTVASVLCGLATNLPLLIAARVLQGLTGGGLLAKAQAFLFETFPKKEQPMAQAFFGVIVIAGPAIGPTLGGYLVTNVDWRWIFFVNVPVGVAGILLCLWALPEDGPERTRSPVDWSAIGLLALGLGALQTLLEEGNSEGWWESSFIVGLAVVAAAALVAFVWRELTASAPVVDLRVLRHRSLWAGSILSVVVGIALYGALFAVPIFAQSMLGYTSQQTGLLLAPSALISALMMPLVGRLLQRYDARVLLTAGALVMVFALWQLTSLSPSTGERDLLVPLLIRAGGTVLMFLPLNMATLGPLPKSDIAAATGFFSLTRQLGGSVGVALLSTLLDRRQAFHHAVLAEKLVSNDPAVLDRVAASARALTARGLDATRAHDAAVALLDHAVRAQAAILSFSDTFWATAALIVASLPLVLLLGRARKGAAVAAAH